jgi:hypothetical protein
LIPWGWQGISSIRVALHLGRRSLLLSQRKRKISERVCGTINQAGAAILKNISEHRARVPQARESRGQSFLYFLQSIGEKFESAGEFPPSVQQIKNGFLTFSFFLYFSGLREML